MLTPKEVERRLRAAGHRVTLGGMTDAAGAAEILGVAERTLREWRSDGDGPEIIMVGRSPLYGILELLAWMAGQKQGKASGDSRQLAAIHGGSDLAQNRKRRHARSANSKEKRRG